MNRLVCIHCGFLSSSIAQMNHKDFCKHEYDIKSLDYYETIALVQDAKNKDIELDKYINNEPS